MTQESVLAFLESQEGRKPPAVMTVTRTKQSSYSFFLLVRHYRTRLTVKPQFYAYTKETAGNLKSLIEEHSVFDLNGAFYVLEGFDAQFIDKLSPAPGTFVLAETNDGTLKAEPYNFYAQRRNILKVLHSQLGLKSTNLNLSALLKLDWSLMKGYEDYEPILRKAKIMEWGVEDIEKILESKNAGNLIAMMKRGQNKELMAIAEQLGNDTFYNYLQSALADLLHYRTLRIMGYDERKCEKELDLSFRRTQDLEEVNKMMTQDDLLNLVDWIITKDPMQEKNAAAHAAILIGMNPIQLRK